MATDSHKLPEDLERFLDAEKSAGKSEQTAISIAINLFSKRQQEITLRQHFPHTAFDLAMQTGFVGAAGEGLASDLSTNPNHMEGFGRAAY